MGHGIHDIDEIPLDLGLAYDIGLLAVFLCFLYNFNEL
jgi:hypothetical protein